jgi:hypothetical protein
VTHSFLPHRNLSRAAGRAALTMNASVQCFRDTPARGFRARWRRQCATLPTKRFPSARDFKRLKQFGLKQKTSRGNDHEDTRRGRVPGEEAA